LDTVIFIGSKWSIFIFPRVVMMARFQVFKQYIPVGVFIGLMIGILWITYVPFPDLIRFDEGDYPNKYVPTILRPGDSMNISNEIERIWINDLELTITDSQIDLPSSLAYGWYNVTFQSLGVNDSRPKSLYLTPFNPNNYTFAQVTDVHTPYYLGADVEERRNIFQLVENLGPLFIVDTGDLTDYGIERQFQNYDYITSELKVPLFTIPGNMDNYADPHLTNYAKYRGPGNYYFSFGQTLFVSGAALHSPRSWGGFDAKQIEWINSTMTKNAELKFLFHHTPIASAEGRDYQYVPWGWRNGHFSQIEQGYDEIVHILEREHVNVLSGHWHSYSAKYEYQNAIYYNTPSIVRMSGSQAGPRFRLFQIINHEIVYDQVIDLDKISITYETQSDQHVIKVIVNNMENFAVPMNVRIQFDTIFSSNPIFQTSQGQIIGSTNLGEVWVNMEIQSGQIMFEVSQI